MRSPASVVQVVEATGQTLVEDAAASKGQGTVSTDRETGSVDGTCLWGFVELELVVGCNVSSTPLVVLEDTVVERQDERAVGLAEGDGGGSCDDAGRGSCAGGLGLSIRGLRYGCGCSF